MAMVAAGFTGGQAEELRRAMGFKRSQERMNDDRDRPARGHGAKRHRRRRAGRDRRRASSRSRSTASPSRTPPRSRCIAYASAYLKAHHPAAFLCALLNNWPMGFYHPATLVTDAARHGVEHAAHRRHALGLAVRRRGRAGARCGSACATSPGCARRSARASRRRGRRRRSRRWPTSRRASQAERSASWRALAEVGAFAALGGTRRQALWQVEALGKSGALFARINRTLCQRRRRRAAARDDRRRRDARRLPRHGSMSTGPHPMSFARDALDRDGVMRAARSGGACPNGRRARIGGVVIVRQRPGTAKGFVFITLEDETGFANAIVTPAALRPAQARDRRVERAGDRGRRAEPRRRRVDQGRSLRRARRPRRRRRHLTRLSLKSMTADAT